MKMMTAKDTYPRSFYYKVYKAMCKMLGCDAIMHGKLSRSWMSGDVIYADFLYKKRPLVVEMNGRSLMLSLSKRSAKRVDTQKEVVKCIMRAAEKHDVNLDGWIYDFPPSEQEKHVIPAGTCFEEVVVNYDLES